MDGVRRPSTLALLCALALIGALGLVSSSSAAAAPTWGTAIELPGSAAFASDIGSGSVSCASPGNCVTGSDYFDSTRHAQAFLAEETNGTWGTAIAVPGMAALYTGADSSVGGISCATPGNCTVGGSYFDGSKNHAWVATETNGTWGTAIDVPGTAALNTGGNALVYS